MLRLEHHALLRRLMRLDDPPELGTPTTELACAAIDEGEPERAKQLVRYTIGESKGLHDLMCDWVYDLLDKVARRFGEVAMHEILRATQETWMMRRSFKGYLKLSVHERVALTAEVLRSHHGGPKQDGELRVVEDEHSLSIVMDPCGSGGRMRRGDPVDGTPSRLGPPYSFGTTSEPHTFSWSKANVPYYCVHCAVNESVMMELGGHPLWVTEFDEDAHKPCAWKFYKRADDIPDVHYTRLGFKKPPPGEGSY